MTLSMRLQGRDNNWNLIRTVAALLVLVSHSYALCGETARDPGILLTGYTPVSWIGLSVFFICSGFLISKSWNDNPKILTYAGKRTARILPALAIAVLGAAIVLGPLVSTLGWGEYFGNPQTWRYVAGNLTFIKMQYELPGVFDSLPYPRAVNGSLWTLKTEVLLYILVPTLCIFGRYLGPLAFPGLVAIVSGLILSLFYYFPYLDPIKTPARVFQWKDSCNLMCYFGMGAIFYSLRDLIPLRRDLMVVASLLFIGSWFGGPTLTLLASFLCLPYISLFAAYTPTRAGRWFSRFGDPSYGIYVYAFPIQQAIVHCVPGITPEAHLAVSCATVIPLGYLSWNRIEKPMLHAARRYLGDNKS